MDYSDKRNSGLLDDELLDVPDADYDSFDDDYEIDEDAFPDYWDGPDDAELCRMAMDDVCTGISEDLKRMGMQLSAKELREHMSRYDDGLRDLVQYVGYGSDEYLKLVKKYSSVDDGLYLASMDHIDNSEARKMLQKYPIGADNPAGMEGLLVLMDQKILGEKPFLPNENYYEGIHEDYIRNRVAAGLSINRWDNKQIETMLMMAYEDDCHHEMLLDEEAEVYEDTKAYYEAIEDYEHVEGMRLPEKYSLAEPFCSEDRHFQRLRSINGMPGVVFSREVLKPLSEEQRKTLAHERMEAIKSPSSVREFTDVDFSLDVSHPQPQAEATKEPTPAVQRDIDAEAEAKSEKNRKLADAPNAGGLMGYDKTISD